MKPPKGTIWINKWVLLVLTASLILSLVFIFLFYAPPARSCAELARQGVTNVREGDKRYNPALDRDKNKIACEK